MKLGIALGGGGAKGFAHIGVLKTLHKHGIKVDIVAGTSIGSLVGAVYAANKLKELEHQTLKFRLTDIPILLSPTWSSSGFFSGKNALELMMKVINVASIEELEKPFGAVSVDLVSGEPVTFSSGNLRHALRSSIAIPGLFTPVRHNNMILVDGGLLNPVPVNVAKALGATKVIAVDLFGERQLIRKKRLSPVDLFPLELTSALNYFRSIPEMIFKIQQPEIADKEATLSLNLIEVIENTLAVTQQAITKSNLAECQPDVLIRPSLNSIGLLDFHRAEYGIKLGTQAAEKLIPEIKKLL